MIKNTAIQPRTIQVFEHQTLRVGDISQGVPFTESELKALALYLENKQHPYYSLVYRGIKFSHYVGVIQVGNCTIEILPKADKATRSDAKKWQAILLDMLQYCHLLKTEVAGTGRLRLKPTSILEAYFDLFLEKINRLIINGLPKKYLLRESNQKALKGRLNLPKHLRKNIFNPERFYVSYQSYEYEHLFNLVLYKTLNVLDCIYLKPKLKFRLKQIIARFPRLPAYTVQPRDFEQLFGNKKYQSYRMLLEIARLILLHFSPDIRAGKHHLLALLFDMNLLYEEYVFRQLKQLEKEHLKVSRQTGKPFWQRRIIRPDILLQYHGKNYVLDTKWKIMQSLSPKMEDLKQLYIYCQYFKAENGVLLFPKVGHLEGGHPIPFHAIEGIPKNYNCQIQFLEVVNKMGKLNKNLGKQLLDKLVSRR